MNLHLTYDDGPSEWTPAILDLLAKHDVKATFFVVGKSIAGREHILVRAAAEGHTIGNHTWSHPRLASPGYSRHEIWDELRSTNFAISTALGEPPPTVWRAPYYAVDDGILDIAADLDLEHIGADIVPEDCFTNDALLIAERVIEAARNTPGRPIVSLHDGIPPDGGSASCTKSRQPTVDAVRIILETLA